VVDLDGHHGDGTASLLSDEPLLTISTHQFGGRTYPGTGAAHDLGNGAGRGFTLNLPLAPGTGDRAYREMLTRVVEPLLRAYDPEVLVVEFGTDGHWADPLLKLRLSTAMYRWMAAWLHRLAHELCEGRLLILGGGGYEPEHVVRCWMVMLAELCGLPLQRVHPEVEEWLAEPPMPAMAGADDTSLLAAEQARGIVFPLHGIA
jgi:acetoin utilization protein AcuC